MVARRKCKVAGCPAMASLEGTGGCSYHDAESTPAGAKPEAQAGSLPAAAKKTCCGMFRRCLFSDGSAWIVVTNHAHEPGDVIIVAKRGGLTTSVRLGRAVDVLDDGKAVPYCFMVAKPAPLRAVDLQVTREVEELEKLYRLPSA